MRYIVASDIHLGHKNTPTEHIIRSFSSTILTQANKDIDILFIAGDLFDHLLYLNTIEAQKIVQFFHHLLTYCYTNDIQLRVLEGTPSHDWYQSGMIAKMNDVRKNKADLLYVKVLDIEHNTKHNKHILYIPDEWCSDQQELERQIKQKLQEHSITQVDISILHGAFKYQTQGHPTKGFLHDEAYFLALTTGFIHIGHYHTYTTFDRIIANGSLERLAHGEEGDKGYVRVDNHSYSFIPNPHAWNYKTINVTPAMDLTKLDKAVFKYPKGSHIRLSVSDSHPLSQAFKDLKIRYTDYHLKKLNKDKASETNLAAYIDIDEGLDLSSQLVSETNIHQALITIISNKHQLSTREMDKLLAYASILRSSEPHEPHPNQ